MSPEDVRALFAGAEGDYRFARWVGPAQVAASGGDLALHQALAAALGDLAKLTGHPLAMTASPEEMTFALVFVAEWRELAAAPGLDGLLAEAASLAAELEAQGANMYRAYRTNAEGGIVGCVSLVRLGGRLGAMSPARLALMQAALGLLRWSVPGLTRIGLMAKGEGQRAALDPAIAALIAVAYDPHLPAATRDSSHAALLAERVAARPAVAKPGGQT